MKILTLLLSLCLCFHSIGIKAQPPSLCCERKITHSDPYRLLVDEEGQPRVKLLNVLELVGMPPLNTSENAFIQINHWAQKYLLRQGERQEPQTIRFEKLKPQIKPLLADLGFIDSIAAHCKTYQGAIVHGSFLSGVRLRFNYLVEQWKKGVRFHSIYFLSGERPLTEEEKENPFMQGLEKQTESEMTEVVWKKSQIPNEMRNAVKVFFVNAKGNQGARPTTDDTVKAWLKETPPFGYYLAVTNAPYINRQHLVMRTIAPNEYKFDTIGPRANDQIKMAIVLDELARCIFQMIQIMEKNKIDPEFCNYLKGNK